MSVVNFVICIISHDTFKHGCEYKTVDTAWNDLKGIINDNGSIFYYSMESSNDGFRYINDYFMRKRDYNLKLLNEGG